MSMYEEIIEILKSNDYYKVRDIVNQLISDEGFIKIIVKEKNPFVFDRFIKMCEFKIDTTILYEERRKFIKKTLDKITSDNCHQIFELSDIDMILVNRYIDEYIVNYYFQDSYYNYMVNFYQMLTYLNESGKNLVDFKNIELYRRFLDLRKISFEEKIKFFNQHLNENIMELFYDDMDILRTDSHKELVNKSIKLTKDSPLYQENLSNEIGIPVYKLDGEPFYGFVRCLSIPRGTYLFNFFDYVNSVGKRIGYSFSYVGDKNIGTIDYDGNYTTLFYDNIDYKNIMYVHHGDLHAKKMDVQDDYLSVKENEITTPKRLVANTNNYNEIYIKGDKEGIRPKALVCYDEITSNDVGFARKYSLSILLINREKYKRYETFDDAYDDYTYVI